VLLLFEKYPPLEVLPEFEVPDPLLEFPKPLFELPKPLFDAPIPVLLGFPNPVFD